MEEYIAIPISEYEELKRKSQSNSVNNSNNYINTQFCNIEGSLHELMMKRYGRTMLCEK